MLINDVCDGRFCLTLNCALRSQIEFSRIQNQIHELFFVSIIEAAIPSWISPLYASTFIFGQYEYET